jgi:polysaccharide deacetylase family protein (PEP-CTERM system associated)
MLPEKSNIPHATPPPRALNALTIDCEEWYHGLTRTNIQPESWPTMTSRAEPSVGKLLDILDEAGVRATFFILGDLARQFPSLVKRIANAGHELGSHGYAHRPVHRLTPDSFLKDLDQTRDVIQQAAGSAIHGFRAPYFSIDPRCLWAFDVLCDAGYEYDSSVFPLRTILYGYAGASRLPYRPVTGGKLVEYPVATIRMAGMTLPVAGGFYWRMLPYPVIRSAIQKLNRQEVPAVFYMHPWELDTDQPHIRVSARERLTHYGGRSTLPGKLHRLCREFNLAPLGEIHRIWLDMN